MSEYYCVSCDTGITENQADKTRDHVGMIYCEDCHEDTFDAAWDRALENGPQEAEW